jgi:hypothetical protein
MWGFSYGMVRCGADPALPATAVASEKRIGIDLILLERIHEDIGREMRMQ